MNIDIFNHFSSFSNLDVFLLFFCAIANGMAKTGLGGLGLIVVPVMASLFGAKVSTGVVLIQLILADFFGVWYYHRHASIKYLIKLIPSTITGVLFGVFLGNVINDNQFKLLLIIILSIGVIITILNLYYKPNIRQNHILSIGVGLLGGISTIIGNAAGPIMTIYFLSMGFKKNNYIGTAAWFFLIVNIFKVPFHFLIWDTINFNIIIFNIMLLPLIFVGAYIGVKVVRIIPNGIYNIILIISVFIGIINLIISSV